MSPDPTPGSVEALYQQLACRRAGSARAALIRQTDVERLLAESAQALEDAAAVLLHAATAFVAVDGALPATFAEHAGALLAVAARFEEAADLSRSRDPARDARERRHDRQLRGSRRDRARGRGSPDHHL